MLYSSFAQSTVTRLPRQLSEDKRCNKCSEQKPLTQFYKRGKTGGVRSICSDCEKYAKLESIYGLTRIQYDDMVRVQAGRCASCETTKHKLNVDHDHATGEVRALLCNYCNTMEGFMFWCRPDLLPYFWATVLKNLREWSEAAEE